MFLVNIHFNEVSDCPKYGDMYSLQWRVPSREKERAVRPFKLYYILLILLFYSPSFFLNFLASLG